VDGKCRTTAATLDYMYYHSTAVHPNKSPLKILRKVAVGVVRDSRKFSGHPYVM